MNSKNYKKIILDKLTFILKPKHFKKAANTFVYSNDELDYFINVQSSQSSTTNTLKVTVNIEIASILLVKLENSSIPEKLYRHFNKRIGSYLDSPHDKWWIITDSETVHDAANEIGELITSRVLPEFDTLQTTNDLANLWRQNKSPGLTTFLKNKYLSLLEQQN